MHYPRQYPPPGPYGYAPGRVTCPPAQPPQPSFARYFQRFPIAPKDVAHYENIFGLCLAIEMIEYDYTSGQMEKNVHDKVIGEMLAQFNVVRNALNLSTDDIAKFCTACQIPSSFLLAAITIDPRDGSGPTASIADGARLGQDLTTLSDLCFMESPKASEFTAIISRIARLMANLRVFERSPEAKRYADKWIGEFSKLRPGDTPPKETIEKLKSDVMVWREVALSVL